jgi:hypothetical protein
MSTVFYTQHELTQEEIDREARKQRAIDRNRAKAAAKVQAEPAKEIFIKDPSLEATTPQKNKVMALLSDLRKVAPDVWKEASPWCNERMDKFTMGEISSVIDRLKLRVAEAVERMAKEPAPAPEAKPAGSIMGSMRVSPDSARAWQQPGNNYPRDKFSDVPDGYYAVLTEAGPLGFYRVSTWKDSGNRKVQVQASDELHPVKSRAVADAVLAKVREITPPVAGKTYADHLGNCWRCGRTLTDETSRAMGIGPVCATR